MQSLRALPTLLVGAAAAAIFASCDEMERELLDPYADYEPNVWTSPTDCEALSPAPAESRPPRVGTWNIRYFPDSEEQENAETRGTHVSWLACAIASLDVDVLAVQEIKNTEKGLRKRKELLQLLNERTNGDWRLETASCAPAGVQHPGLLWNASRVSASALRDVPALNPNAECDNYASPGFAGYFEIQGGPDFHLIAVHLAVGASPSAVADRAESIAAMQSAAREARALVPDDDVVFAGDFNTGGCDECDPEVSHLEEVATIAAVLPSYDPPLSLVPANEPCSWHNDSGSRLLDHLVVSASMRELEPGAVAGVTGICHGSCARLTKWYELAYLELSDHCPVLVDLSASDDD